MLDVSRHVSFAAVVLVVAGGCASAAAAGHRGASTTRTFRVAAGRSERRFELREPGGVILLSRLTVPDGVRAYVDATVPGVAGTRFSTRRPNDPALSCVHAGGATTCTQRQEWCPMPAARWRMRLVKLGGPAGVIRVDYVVGPPPPTG